MVRRVIILTMLYSGFCSYAFAKEPINYEQKWHATLDTLIETFRGVDTVDYQTGYMQSEWVTFDFCPNDGPIKTKLIPCERIRALVRVKDRASFKVIINVQHEKRDTLKDSWGTIDDNINLKIEKGLMNDLAEKIRRLEDAPN